MGRILGLDYGRRRLGIAASDPLKIMAVPIKTLLMEKTIESTLPKLKEAIADLGEIEKIIVGLPLLLSGEAGEMANEATLFAKQIEAFFQIPVVLIDERLTSQMADKSLKSQDLSRKKRAKKIDNIAATIILQSYLDQQKV